MEEKIPLHVWIVNGKKVKEYLAKWNVEAIITDRLLPDEYAH
jgi:hypothetical protein